MMIRSGFVFALLFSLAAHAAPDVCRRLWQPPGLSDFTRSHILAPRRPAPAYREPSRSEEPDDLSDLIDPRPSREDYVPPGNFDPNAGYDGSPEVLFAPDQQPDYGRFDRGRSGPDSTDTGESRRPYRDNYDSPGNYRDDRSGDSSGGPLVF